MSWIRAEPCLRGNVCPDSDQRAPASRADGNPRFLVLLAAYNGLPYLDAQISSILGQQGIDVEIVISDDASTDGTAIRARELAERQPNVHLLPGSRRFGSAAGNFFRLVREAQIGRADYVAFADQDDIWDRAKLRRASEILQRTGAGGYSSNVTAWYPDGRRRVLHKAQRQRSWDYLFSSPGPGCTHVLTADMFVGFQELVRRESAITARIDYHDWLDYAFVRSQGIPWHIDEWPSLLYRQHGMNQLGANVGRTAAWRRLTDLRSGWLWGQALAVAECVGASEGPAFHLRRGGLRSRLALCALSPSLRRSRREGLVLGLSFLFARDPRSKDPIS